jgi:FAD/FMN-containing dehydrogenase
MTWAHSSRTGERLRERMRGTVLSPGDAGYDEARMVWNARFDRRPAAIALCSTEGDVQAALAVARESGLPVSVRGGGHDYAGYGVCDDGLVIDVGPINQVRIDRASKTAHVGAGATWGAFDREAQAVGLATTGPTVSTVGVAGSTLGGGTGYLSRRFGLSLDNLLSADVVTAAGDRLRASDREHEDLFWALRGGGGNFGIVTGLEYRLHEVGPEVLAGQVVYRIEDAGAVLRFYREFMAAAPDEVQCYPVIFRVPAVPAFPAEFQGQLAIDLVVAHTGAIDAGEKALAPLRGLGHPILSAIAPTSYTAVQQTFDPGTPKGHRWYSKAHYLDALTDGAIDTLLEHIRDFAGALTIVYFEPMGGVLARIRPDATAFPHRAAAHSFHVLAGWSDADDDQAVMSWAASLHRAMARHANGGVYVNLLDPDEAGGVRAAYGPNYERLARIKATYDPGNLFRLNHNIEPSAV